MIGLHRPTKVSQKILKSRYFGFGLFFITLLLCIFQLHISLKQFSFKLHEHHEAFPTISHILQVFSTFINLGNFSQKKY